MLIENPHCFSCVNRRTTANGNDNIRTKLLHRLGALEYGFDRRIRLDALKQHRLQPSRMESVFRLLEETAALHRAAACDNDGLFVTLQIFEFIDRMIAIIEIPWKCKTSHAM